MFHRASLKRPPGGGNGRFGAGTTPPLLVTVVVAKTAELQAGSRASAAHRPTSKRGVLNLTLPKSRTRRDRRDGVADHGEA